MAKLFVVLLLALAISVNGRCLADSQELEKEQCAVKSENPLTDGNDQGGDPIPRPNDDSLHGIYAMTNTFLEDLVETSSLSAMLQTIDETDEVADTLINYLIGYIIAVGIGLIFIIMVPIMGCCFCICRTCCCCCSKKDPLEGKHAKCKRITFGSCFFALIVLFIFGMSFAFASASFLNAQFRADGLVNNIAMSLDNFDTFTEDMVGEFWDLKDESIDPMLTTVTGQLEEFPAATYNELGETTGISQDLQELDTYTDGLLPSKENFIAMNTTVEELKTKELELNRNISTWKKSVESKLGSCQENSCKNVTERAKKFEETLDFTSLTEVDPAIEAINEATTNGTSSIDIGTLVGVSVTAWEGLGDGIANVSSEPLDQLTKQMSTFSTEIENFMNETSKLTESVNTEQIQKDLKENVGPTLEEFSPIIYGAFLLPCFIPLFIAFCYFLGFILGIFTGPPGKGSKFCNRGKGACSLMCGVGCTYLCSWIVMLFVLIFFIVGSVSHNMACKHLVKPSESEDISMINKFMQKSMNTSMDFLQVVEECGENKAMYTALQIEKVFPEMNITDLLDLSRFGFDEIQKKIADLEIIKDHDVSLMNDEIEDHLKNLDGEFSNVDFQEYFDAASQDITNEPIRELIEFIQKEIDSEKNSNVKDDLEKIKTELVTIKNMAVTPIEEDMKELDQETKGADEFVSSLKIPSFIDEMKEAQGKITDEKIQEIIKGQTKEVYGELEKLVNDVDASIRCDIGKCKSLILVAEGLVSSVCVFMLYPFNGFWFCLGWCAAVSLPLLFFAVILIGQYRKQVRVEPSDREAVYNINIDMTYAGKRQKKRNMVAPTVTPL